MAHDERVDASDPLVPQVRGDDARARVGRFVPPGSRVVDESVPVRADDDREPLPDVEHDDPRRARGGRRGRRQSERREPQRAERAAGNAPRREHPGDAEDRRRERPRERRVLHPGGRRQLREPLEHRHQRREHGVRGDEARVERHEDARDRERHHREGHDRDRERVGERRDDRHLPEQRQRERHEAHGDRPLRPRPFAQRHDESAEGARRAPARHAPGVRVDQHGDRAVRQPESRRQHRPGIEREHRRERPQPHHARRAAARGEEPERPGREHRERAQRRHLGAREQRVAARREHARDRADVPRRQAIGEPRRPARQRRSHRARERRERGHVQARDAHEVAHAGAVEHGPLLVGDRALVADRKGGDDAGEARLAERGGDALAHPLARALHAVAPSPAERVDPRVRGRLAHVAGGAQAALEEPGLEVEPARIRVAVRALQPHDQPPALARPQLRRRDVGFVLVAGTRRGPRQRKASRHARARRLDALDGERESQAARRRVGQVVDDARDEDVDAFPLVG